MNKNINLIIEEELYTEKLENGLTVMIMNKKDFQKKYVIWGTYYGSIDSEFVNPNNNQKRNVPDGIAHFLEHKLFEQENGTNSLDTLTSLGANANAYTSNNHTAYLFECTDNFFPCLDELMDYVQHPYFTDENVEKEKGIINQEILMYQDSPFNKLYMNMLECMYVNNPVKIDIAGTVESISQIDREVLYECYNTFYHPSNMIMFLIGDFEPEKILNEVKKRLIKRDTQKEIERIYKEEPLHVYKQDKVQNMEVSLPLFAIGIKDNNVQNQENILKKHVAIEIILQLLVGKSSKLFKKLYEEGLVVSEIESEYDFEKRYSYIAIVGQSKDPKEIEKRVKNEIEKLKNGIPESDFLRIKKMLYGEYIKNFNDIATIARMFISDHFKDINSFDYFKVYKNIDKEYVENILETIFILENMVLAIVKNKKEKT